MSDKLEEEINLYNKIIVKNYNDLSLAEQFEKGVVVKVDDELAKVKQQLAIAVEALDKVATYMTCDEVEIREIQPNFCADQAALDTVNEAMDKIKELNNDKKD